MSVLQTVLVTGAQGLLGRHIVRALNDTGRYRVAAVSHRDTLPAQSGVRWLTADLRHAASAQALSSANASIIVHTAAVLPKTMDDEAATAANEAVDAQVLQLARNTRASLVYLSSQSVYEGCATPWDESMAVRPSAAYASGKHHTEMQAQLLETSTASLRISSPYSASDTTRPGVLYHFAREAVAGKPLIVMGDGHRTQDFVHGVDVAHAVLAILHRWERLPDKVHQETFNIASGQSVSMSELAHCVVSCAGGGNVVHAGSDAHAAQRTALSIAKAWAMLGWKPQVELRAGLAQLIRHMRGSHEDWLAV